MPANKTLGSVLQTLLDDPRCHSRQDWSEILGVSVETLESWVKDESLPIESTVSCYIQKIVDLACEQAPDLRAVWESIVDQYSLDIITRTDQLPKICSMEHLVATTIGAYSLTYRYAGLLRALGVLPYDQQVAFLNEVVSEVLPRYRPHQD